jgi:hypothetical protein
VGPSVLYFIWGTFAVEIGTTGNWMRLCELTIRGSVAGEAPLAYARR